MSDLHMTRTFDAPREIVWELWTNPAHAKQWWGPENFTCPRYESDLRVGGVCYCEMEGPDGSIYPSKGVYEDVAVPQRIVLSGTAEANGTVLMKVRTTTQFDEHDGKTTMTVDQDYVSLTPAAEGAREGAPMGWAQMLDKFENYIAQHRSGAVA